MNCYYHPNESAVAQCVDCNRGLCSNCARQYTIIICPSCNRKRMSQEKGKIIKEIFLTFGIGLLLTYWVTYGQYGGLYKGENNLLNIGESLFMFYMYSGIIAGWLTLDRITPQVFLILPLIGWIIYFVAKIFLSIWVGLVMLPIRTFRNIKRYRELMKIPIYSH